MAKAQQPAEQTPAKQPKGLPAHLRDDLKWKPGQSGNPKGRAKGARTKLAESFCQALLDDFQKNGVAAITTMREEKAGDYIRALVSVIPKEFDASVTGDLSEDLKRWLGIG